MRQLYLYSFQKVYCEFSHCIRTPCKRYGKNACPLQVFTAGPRHVKLAGGYLVTVPRPQPLQRHGGLLRTCDDTPQGTGSRHEEAKGIGTPHALVLPTLVLRHAIRGMAITASNCHGPAIVIRLQQDRGRARHLGAAKGFTGLETPKGLRAVGRFGALEVRSPDHHDPHGPSGEDAVPEPHPGWDKGPCFLWVRLPSGRGCREGLGRADPVAFFARCPAPALGTHGRQWREGGRA